LASVSFDEEEERKIDKWIDRESDEFVIVVNIFFPLKDDD